MATASPSAARSAARPERSKAQLARDFIRERIADGTYPPGFRLVLGQIARELDVSPVPVREAVRMLEAEGVVTYAHNVGAHVAILGADVYVDTLQTLALVEGYATALSAPLLRAEDLAEAREVNAELAAAIESFDPARFTQLNGAFHAVLVRACPNGHVLELVERGWARLRTLRESPLGFAPGRAGAAVDEHEEIVRLIESDADPDTIERAARRHRLATLEAFLSRTLPEAASAAQAGGPAELRISPDLHRASPGISTRNDSSADSRPPRAG